VRIGILHQGGSAKEAQDEANKTTGHPESDWKPGGSAAANPDIATDDFTDMSSPGRATMNHRGLPDTRLNLITVTLDILGLVGPVVDAGLENGVNQLEGVQFGLKNDGPARELALHLAISEAKGKAVAMADALAVTLGPVQEVSEAGVSIVPLGSRSAESFAVAARAAVPTPVSAGQLEIRASVVVKYAIGPKTIFSALIGRGGRLP
jgi:hypothetical protein